MDRTPSYPEEALRDATERKHDNSWQFVAVLDKLEALHRQKQNDYGTNVDPYANVRASEAFGLPAWIGVAIRMQDKMKRLQTASTQHIQTGEVHLSNETLEDTFMDLAVYGIIGLIMLGKDVTE